MDEKSKQIKKKDKIVKQYKVMADDWAEMVMVRVAGSSNNLQPSDTRYHKDCLLLSTNSLDPCLWGGGEFDQPAYPSIWPVAPSSRGVCPQIQG